MKLINIVTHPVLVIISFCIILISGEHFGGLYLLYILMAIPHGGIHAVLALVGSGLVLFSYARYNRRSTAFTELVLNIVGIFTLYGSLWLFFYNSWNYNEGTFRQTMPLVSLALFGIVSLTSMLNSIARFGKTKPNGSPAY